MLNIWVKILEKSGKYSATRSAKVTQKFLDSTKKSGDNKVAIDQLKTASKRTIQKIVEVIGKLIGINIADKITKNVESAPVQTENTFEIRKEIYMPPEEKTRNYITINIILTLLRNYINIFNIIILI